MSNYKLMPVEPTREQLDAFKSLWAFGFCNDDMARNCYRTFMQTAPEVGGDGDCPAMTICKLCPPPPVQDEPVLYVSQYAIVDPEVVGMHATRTPNELQCVPLYAAPQPAPDVAEMAHALRCAMAFIKSHVADPDITPEMQSAYRELEAAKPDEILARYAESINSDRLRGVGASAALMAQALARVGEKLRKRGGDLT